ncbi:MAG TPA: hypothetical protein VKM55_01040 [Candidatus Lokiarchaeia archaeon]|nr:hypothetical protein [Candidatus Lokiarchaeia archaeon]
MTKRKRRPAKWSLVKFRCKVGDDTIRKAKELGMSPRALLASNASRRDEPWKSPVDRWVDDLYEKRFSTRELKETKPGNELQ